MKSIHNYTGNINLLEFSIPCAVTKDGVRLLSRTALDQILGIPELFKIASVNVGLNTLIKQDDIADIDATLLVDICCLWMDAKSDNKLNAKQLEFADRSWCIFKRLTMHGKFILTPKERMASC